jgi:hypothetical protein
VAPSQEFPPTHPDCRCAPPTSPHPPGSSWSNLKRPQHRFLAYAFPSRSPGPTHPAVLDRPDFVAAAPTLPTAPWIRLPPASPHRYDGRAAKDSHLHSDSQRLAAHHSCNDTPDQAVHIDCLMHRTGVHPQRPVRPRHHSPRATSKHDTTEPRSACGWGPDTGFDAGPVNAPLLRRSGT